MSFLATIWLSALTALALPVALHLMSRGHRRRVRLGTVRFLVAGSSNRARRWRPSQLLLLLVRCLLLAALALALAEPRGWLSAADPAARGWILLDPRIPAHPSGASRSALDRLAGQGHDRRLLADGFPRWKPESAGTAGDEPEEPADIWSLLREADAVAPPGAPFFVFTEDRAAALRGARPTLTRSVEWHPQAIERQTRWVERAGPIRGDAVPLTLGAGEAAGTTFERRRLDLSSSEFGIPGLKLDRTANGAELRLDGREIRIAASQPLDVAIRSARDRAADAGFVRAALEAAAGHLDVPLRIETAAADGEAFGPDGAEAELIIWLSGAPVPEAAFSRSRVVLSDGSERSESCPRPIRAGHREIELRRCSAAEPVEGEAVLWSDGRGRPLLAASRRASAVWYRFHGRFHPRWSDLVHGPALPEWLLELLRELSEDLFSAAAAADVRTAGSQMRPRTEPPRTQERRGGAPSRASRAVEQGLWLSVALLFAMERGMAGPARRPP